MIESVFNLLHDQDKISDFTSIKQFKALVYSLYAFNILGRKGHRNKNYMLTDLSKAYSGKVWVSSYGALFRQQLQKGHHTFQIHRIVYDLEQLKRKSTRHIAFALDHCYDYLNSLHGGSRRILIGDIAHPILEAIIYRFFRRKLGGDSSDFETGIMRVGKYYRRVDTTIAKDAKALENLRKLLSKSLSLNGDFDIKAIKYIVIDYTLSSNIKFLTQKRRPLGKVWKKYHSSNRLLLIVNFDPKLRSSSLRLDMALQRRMNGRNVPNSENIRFITLKDFYDIFDLDDIARSELDILQNKVKAALRTRTDFEKLYHSYFSEMAYLSRINKFYSVGWRTLRNLPF